jgi:hypothetical protein
MMCFFACFVNVPLEAPASFLYAFSGCHRQLLGFELFRTGDSRLALASCFWQPESSGPVLVTRLRQPPGSYR